MTRLLLGLFALALFSGASSAQDDLPPYLYYRHGSGYVIERADGTATRFIDGPDGLPGRMDHAAWSPSGAWLAWRAYGAGSCGSAAEPQAEHLIIAGAGSVVSLAYDWVQFAWSKGEDTLFVVYGEGDAERWAIIDPTAPDEPRASGDLTGDTYAVRGFFGDEADPTTWLRGEPWPGEDTIRGLPSPTGEWTAYMGDGPIIETVATGERQYVPPIPSTWGGWIDGHVMWHPTEKWLISHEIGVAACGGGSEAQVTDGDAHYILPGCAQPPCAEWLPASVDPAVFPAFEKPETITPAGVLRANDWVLSLVWSDDGTLYARGGFDPGTMHYATDPLAAWDVAAREPLPDAEFPPYVEPPFVKYNDEYIAAQDQRYIVTWGHVYDAASGTVLGELDSWAGVGRDAHISPDGTYLVSAETGLRFEAWSLPDGGHRTELWYPTAAAISPDSRFVAIAFGWDVHIYTRESLGF